MRKRIELDRVVAGGNDPFDLLTDRRRRGEVRLIGMGVEPDPVADAAAEQFMDSQPELLAPQVP
jgi:hypothetical protein